MHFWLVLKKNNQYQSLLVHAKQSTVETKPYSFLCLILPYQVCLLLILLSNIIGLTWSFQMKHVQRLIKLIDPLIVFSSNHKNTLESLYALFKVNSHEFILLYMDWWAHESLDAILTATSLGCNRCWTNALDCLKLFVFAIIDQTGD